jgi:hypothetical protein
VVGSQEASGVLVWIGLGLDVIFRVTNGLRTCLYANLISNDHLWPRDDKPGRKWPGRTRLSTRSQKLQATTPNFAN